MRDIELLDQFLKSYESRQTRRAYGSDLRAVIGRLESNITVATPGDVRNAFHQASKNLRGSSRYRRLSALRSFAHWLLASGIVGYDITSDLKDVLLSSENQAADFPLTVSEVELILKCNSERTAKSLYRDVALFAIALDSGLRRTELAAMDFEHFECSKNHIALRVVASRAGPEARLYLSSWSYEHLQQMIVALGFDDGPVWRSHSNNSKGERLTPESIYRIIRSMTRRAEIGRVVTPETLRITAFYRRLSAVALKPEELDSPSDLTSLCKRL